jgi:hypothetical protein
MRLLLSSLLLGLLIPTMTLAQPSPPKSPITTAFVQKEFGNTCKLLDGPTPMMADLNGDGIEDLAVAAHCSNPLVDQAEHGYRVIDPYNTFFGYGDPKISTDFASEDPEHRGMVLLIIHGSGPDAWRSDQPKAKFMIVNLPFKQLMVKKLRVRKKLVMAIYADEGGADGQTSATFWDGRKYRYQPMGSTQD